jgi:hypothetical protein
VHDIRRFLLPESAVVVTCYHVGRRRILRPETARAATTVLLLFVLSFLLGTMTALLTGEIDLTEALFEGVSVGANIGISVGVVAPDMPRAAAGRLHRADDPRDGSSSSPCSSSSATSCRSDAGAARSASHARGARSRDE